MMFTNQVQYVWEAVAILSNAASGELDLVPRAGDFPEREDLQRLSQIQTEAVQGLSEVQIRRYFRPLNSGRDCTAEYLGCFHEGPSWETLEEAAQRYDRLTLDQRLLVASDGDETGTLAGFTDYLGTLELDDGVRWQILTAMLHPEVHKDGIFDLLAHVIEKLRRHGPELEAIFARNRQALADWDREHPVLNLLKDPNAGYLLQDDVIPQELTVLLFHPSTFRGRIGCAGGRTWFYIGAFMPHFLTEKSCQSMQKQDIVNYGKIFSDGSKLEILRLLSQRCCINRELAQALGLSTATISHHMSVLSEMGLVHTTISANRVLYDLNREKLTEISAGMAAYLEDLAKAT